MNGRAWIPHVPRPSRLTATLASRTGAPVIDPSTVAEVLSNYGAAYTSPPRNLRLARRSLNVTVTTPVGDRVLKCYRPQWKPATVRYGHSILEHLEARGVPAVRLARTSDGETFVVRDDRVFALFEFVEGVNYSLNFLRRRDRLRLTVMAGETLAGLHRNGEDYVPDGEHHLGLVSHAGPWRRDLAWHAEAITDLGARSRELGDPEAAVPAQRLRQRSAQLLDEISTLHGTLASADLPALVIHGDYGLHNLLFQLDGQPPCAVPVDFELSRLDWRINDLISALGKYRYRGGHYDFESMQTFVAAYAAAFPLTDEEVRLLPEAWRLYKLQAAVQYWNSYFETDGPARKLESALDSIEQAHWVLDRPAIISQLAHAARPTPRRAPVTVLQVTPNLEVGGAQENLRTMARYLPEAGCPTVVCTFDDGPLRRDIEQLGVAVEVLPSRRHGVVALPLFLLEMRRMRRDMLDIIARQGADVVQTYGLGTLDFLVATLALARPWSRRFSRRAPLSRRVRVWWTIENVRFMVRAEHLSRSTQWMLRPKRAAHRLMYRASARVIDGIIAVSDETETAFRNAVGYDGDKVHVVANAADMKRFGAAQDRNAIRAELGLTPDAHLMTMVGTFKRQKGHAVLLAALRSVLAECPQLHVLLVGDGELFPEMRRRAQDDGLTSQVHFLGTRRDVEVLLGASDSFVLPSLWEGLSVALVEAMAAGLPVIATAVSGTRQVMVDGETGWLVPPDDPTALSGAIRALLANPGAARALGAAGRRRVASMFGAQKQAEELAALFRGRGSVRTVVPAVGGVGAVAR
jgi:glycosyltransferase involved in cell wall biosynthesis/Ser/Thr protein kinase RdoA (MazF antagonist)